MNKIFIPISIGELFDKITILQIKQKEIKDPKKLVNVNNELKLLVDISKEINFSLIQPLIEELKIVNMSLWNIEESKREYEVKQLFDEKFIDLSRSVYILNDKRASLKKQINIITNSEIIEEKSYE